mmetsp:Transcript_8932/g.9909  ORF Transcript_8932/g.9909 Transcript_8932/m.9909 type:complete len:100 (+) Transcript_8932:60-359(+)|eukprot:CAMPEP_0168519288 /NCGR_PEP_ID=MMETSP0405-20121227/7226_1 /TAXON_ID=498012 /ORGANISM="Trichosphaerium sp, Strain Am-I-7 wt" /LENGTH=99 /DNA_ID=CAMNT_0008539797 /DNA_START=57 /DNA_END=356 /DNA_ORIENTATION=+
MKTRRRDYNKSEAKQESITKPYEQFCNDFSLADYSGCTLPQVNAGIAWVTSQICGGKVQLDEYVLTSFHDHNGSLYSDRESDVQILYFPPSGMTFNRQQ